MNDMGTLFIIATPIGNMGDMTFRAVETLKNEIDALFCEDTRVSRKILDAYGIKLPTYPFHAHSSESSVEKALTMLKEGKSIGYMTDCGTPGISDPGSRLVERASESGITISPLPGASALTSLVSISGFSSKNLLFAGFVSKKPGRRINELSALAPFKGTIIIYESPHRIHKTLDALAEVFPDKPMVVGRELTKHFEEIMRSTTTAFAADPEKIKAKGEFCIAIDNNQ